MRTMTRTRTAGALATAGLAALSTLTLQAPAAALTVGAEQTGTAATAEDETGRMMLLLDSSGSMKEQAGGGQTKIEAARTAMGDVIDGLPDDADVGLRVYGSEVFSRDQKGACTDSVLAVPPGTDNRDDLRDAVDSYKPYGETPTGHALRQAAKDLGGEGKRSIVLVSDGEATCQPDPCKVAKELHEQGIDLKIDVVALDVAGKARAQLRCVAAAGGGEYYDAESSDEIVESLQEAAERAINPFQIEGTPIEGSTEPIEPTPIKAGLWSDRLGPNGSERGELFYEFTRTMEDSTVHVTVNAFGAGLHDRLRVHAATPEGRVCDTESDVRGINRTQVLAPALVIPSRFDPEDPCLTSEKLVISVSRSSRDAEPNEPFSIKIAEEPGVAGTDQLPEGQAYNDGIPYQAPDVTGEMTEVRGGSSFGAATEVETGRYRGEIVPGETQVFKVTLGWGQRLNTRVVYPQSTQAVRRLIGVIGPFSTLNFYNSNRAAVSSSMGDGVSHTASAGGANASHIEGLSAELRYRNREEAGNGAYLPGDYYIAVSVNPDSDGDTYLLPFTMEIEVTGDEAPGPGYADGAEYDAGEDATEQPADDADAEDEAGAEDEADGEGREEAGSSDEGGVSDGMKVAMGAGLGAVALGALVWGIALLRRPGA